MGKKSNWFSLVKRLFIPEGKSKEEKKVKRWRWVFGRLKIKQYPAISVPEKTLSEATEEQRKHALAVAIATAAAAEAAVNAAHAAAEVVRLTTVPSGSEKRNRNLAATKIQACFRAYLARKALRALKGVVRLQAVVRGQIVRRTLISHLKSLQSISKAHSQAQHVTVPRIDESCIDEEENKFISPKKLLEDKNTKLGCKINKNWDYSLFSKEDVDVSWLQKNEAITRRDRMKKYSFSHRERRNNVTLEESTNKENGRRPWFEECQDVGACTMMETDKLKTAIHANLLDSAKFGRRQVKQKNGHKEEKMEILNSSISLPRRSFCRSNKQENSIANDTSLPSSPVFPTYMAATESAKAKIRSTSTPRQRLGHVDFCAVHSSLYKPRISSWSSFDGGLGGVNGKNATSQHKYIRN